MTADGSRRDQPSREGGKRRRGPTGGAERITIARRDSTGGPAWEIVQPRCARRRRDDIAEVEEMIAGGEPEIARDELVWLLSECPDFLEAHVHLGLIALEEGDAKLARGHFGRAYELCLRALEAAGNPRPLPHAIAGNQPFFEAAKGLVHCLLKTGRRPLAANVCRLVGPLDPADPLGIQKLLTS
ncbi:MAG: hypothetical protein ACKO1M_04160 [Planctomycetota bacterium]